MKKQLVKLTAFSAAGLLIFGAAVPYFPVKAHTYQDEEYNMDDIHISSYPDWVFSRPDWTTDMAEEPHTPIKHSDAQPGKFYIHKHFVTKGPCQYPVYQLIRVDDVCKIDPTGTGPLCDKKKVFYTTVESEFGDLRLESGSFFVGT